MLGLFDSGLGGLTVLRRVRQLMPSHDLLYFADQAHVPYGDRSAEELRALLEFNIGWLDVQGADAIVMACNTSCAIADTYGWPRTTGQILDLIESAAIAVHDAGYTRVGIVATTATVDSGAYARKIRALTPSASVSEVSAPALVPLVEARQTQSADARAAVAAACAQLPRDTEAVVLACTHYPLLDEQFAAALGDGVARIDPALEQAGRTAALVAARAIAPGIGRTRYVTSGNLDSFRASITAVMGDANPHCERLEPARL
jgi:glutamate racemase